MSVKRLCIAIVMLAVMTTFALADHTNIPLLESKWLIRTYFCTEIATGIEGMCEVYEGGYLAFWTGPGTIAWVKLNGEKIYVDGEVDA